MTVTSTAHQDPSSGRRLALIAGSILLACLWLGPLPRLAHHTFFAHMIIHMGLVAGVAPLLALGLRGGPWDPVPRNPGFFAPIPASVAELIIVWAFHAPGLHHWARHSSLGFIAEQGSFLLVGLWLWLSSLSESTHTEPGRGRVASGVIAMLLTSMHMTFLGALLALAPRPLYPQHHGWKNLSALQDQHLGGAIMILGGGVVYLAAGLWMTKSILKNRAILTT